MLVHRLLPTRSVNKELPRLTKCGLARPQLHRVPVWRLEISVELYQPPTESRTAFVRRKDGSRTIEEQLLIRYRRMIGQVPINNTCRVTRFDGLQRMGGDRRFRIGGRQTLLTPAVTFMRHPRTIRKLVVDHIVRPRDVTGTTACDWVTIRIVPQIGLLTATTPRRIVTNRARLIRALIRGIVQFPHTSFATTIASRKTWSVR